VQPNRAAREQSRPLWPLRALGVTDGQEGRCRAPANAWAFSGGLGNFTLPAAGGEKTFPLTPGQTVTVSETDRPGWAATVACAPGGQTGIASVTLTLGEAVPATCTFTNTLCRPGYYDNGTICKAAQLPCPDGTTSGGAASVCTPIGAPRGQIFISLIAKQ